MGKIARSQIAGMNFHYKHYSFAYFLDSMVRYGFTRIELWGASPHFYVDDITLPEIRGIKREIEQRNMELVCFTPEQCVYPINIASMDARIRQRSLRYFEKSAEVAYELGAPMLLVTPGWGYENEPRDEAWKRSRESLAELADKAADLGLVLALEPLTRVESNLIYNRDTLQSMLREVDALSLKGMIDTIPMAQAGENFLSYHDSLQEKLVHVHFIDGKPEGHLAWGEGVLPLGQYMEELAAINYAGSLTLEFTAYKYLPNPEEATEQSLRVLEPYLAQ